MKQESKEALEVSRRGGGLDQNVYDDRVICKEATLQKSKQKIPPSYMKGLRKLLENKKDESDKTCLVIPRFTKT